MKNTQNLHILCKLYTIDFAATYKLQNTSHKLHRWAKTDSSTPEVEG